MKNMSFKGFLFLERSFYVISWTKVNKKMHFGGFAKLFQIVAKNFYLLVVIFCPFSILYKMNTFLGDNF